MKYIFPWEEPNTNRFYRRFATHNVVVHLNRLSRSYESPLWLFRHWPTPETPISKAPWQHYEQTSPKPIMDMLDKWLEEQGYITIPFSTAAFV